MNNLYLHIVVIFIIFSSFVFFCLFAFLFEKGF